MRISCCTAMLVAVQVGSLMVACGSVGQAVDAAPPDADTAVDASGDGIDAAAGLGPWGSVTEVAELSTEARGPSLTADLLELYFSSGNRPGGVGGYDIYRSTRARITDAWSTPVLVLELSTSSGDADPSVSPDGLSLWFSTDRDPISSWDIYVSVRASRSSPWGAPTAVDELNTTAGDASPSVSASGLLIAFHSDRGTAGDADIFISTRPNIGANWGTPVPVAEVNSAVDDFDPFLSANGLELYVTAARTGGAGGRDLYVSTRARLTGLFSTPVHIDELATPGLEEAPWVSADSRLIFFSGTSSNGSTGIMQAVR
jgi:Tol biopolymer transport system component